MRTKWSKPACLAAVGLLTAVFSSRGEIAPGGTIQDLRFYAGMTAVGVPGVTYEIQFSTNLNDTAAWTTLRNVVLDTNRLFFVDLDSPFSTARFYRLQPVATNEVAVALTGGAADASAIAGSPANSQKASSSPTIGLQKVPATDGWRQIIDPDGDCQVQVKGDAIRIEVPGKAHDYAAELKRWNAPRVLTEVEGDFVITVDIGGKFQPTGASTISGRRPYHGAGLLLVQDEQNHLSLQRGAVLLGKRMRHYANFELRQGPEGKVSNYEFDIEDREVSLRVARHGNRIMAMASQDGVTWREFKPIEVDFPQKLKVGVEAISSSKTPLPCSFEGLAVYRE